MMLGEADGAGRWEKKEGTATLWGRLNLASRMLSCPLSLKGRDLSIRSDMILF